MRGRVLVRRRRRLHQGAETLEFVGIVGLAGLVLMVGLRALGLVELQLRAENDARALARDAAVCEHSRAALGILDIDNLAPLAEPVKTSSPSGGLVEVSVVFESQELIPSLAATAITPRATVSMRREPGCP